MAIQDFFSYLYTTETEPWYIKLPSALTQIQTQPPNSHHH